MDSEPYIAKLFIHPIKALDRVAVDQVTVLNSGALKGDRTLAIFDQAGNFVNGKRHHRVHALRAQFDLDCNTVSISVLGTDRPATFQMEQEQEALAAWLSEYFGFPVQLQQNLDVGFPDDTMSPGPTIISTATLEAITSWYPNLDVEEIRLRFRTNIEIGGVPAFWEDRLFITTERTVDFQIGTVKLVGVNPCQRCVVVTRNSQTGAADPTFQKTFVLKRQATLPNWVERSRFNHFYRLAVNTRVPPSEAGKTIAIGDKVNILTPLRDFSAGP